MLLETFVIGHLYAINIAIIRGASSGIGEAQRTV